MNIVVIVLRILHIFSGVYWVGAAWMMAFFIEPASRAAGPGAAPFMQKLMEGGRLSMSITIAAVITVLAGGALYFMIWWQVGLSNPVTIGFTLGAILGIISLGVGGAVTGPTVAGMGRLGAEIAAAGKPPSPEQMGQMQALQDRLAMASKWTAYLTAGALLFMATARYWSW